jgi:membrane AbrB-like protein
MARDEPSLTSAAAAAPPQDWRSKALAIILALAIGGAGGYVFKILSLPLPWMLGSMSFVTAATVMGLKPRIPKQFRAVMITVLGIMLGSSFTPEIFARMAEWIVTMSALALWMVLAGMVGLVYFRRVAGYDPVTAYFAATPGGLNEMVIVGGAMGGDERTISLTHASRIMLVVFTIPLWYRFGATVPLAPRPEIGLFDVAWQDLAVLALCAPVGALAARALRIPAGFLVGPMVLSAFVHLIGLTASKPPDDLVAFAQIAIGAAIGARFTGVTISRMARTAAHAVVSAIFMLAMTVLFALILARWTGNPVPALVLAFAPGGLAEMSLVALALSVDAAFVASHHIARIIMVVTLAPLVFRLTRRKA